MRSTSPMVPKAALTGSAREIVDYTNTRIRQGWTDNEVNSSSVAGDAEWIRRVHLDLVGAIPSLEAVEASAGRGSRIRGVEHRVDADDILGCLRELLCRLILPEGGLGILVALALLRFMQPCGPHPQQAHHAAGDVGFDQELLANWLCA